MRGMWLLVAGIALIAAAYLADGFVDQLMRQRPATFDMTPAVVAGVAARLATMGGILGLGWLAVRAPRTRLVGALMVLLGAYFGLAELVFVFNLGQLAGLPFVGQLLSLHSDLSLWASSGIALVGVLCVFWPTPASHGTEAAVGRWSESPCW